MPEEGSINQPNLPNFRAEASEGYSGIPLFLRRRKDSSRCFLFCTLPVPSPPLPAQVVTTTRGKKESRREQRRGITSRPSLPPNPRWSRISESFSEGFDRLASLALDG